MKQQESGGMHYQSITAWEHCLAYVQASNDSSKPTQAQRFSYEGLLDETAK